MTMLPLLWLIQKSQPAQRKVIPEMKYVLTAVKSLQRVKPSRHWNIRQKCREQQKQPVLRMAIPEIKFVPHAVRPSKKVK